MANPLTSYQGDKEEVMNLGSPIESVGDKAVQQTSPLFGEIKMELSPEICESVSDKSVQRTTESFPELKMEFSPDICKSVGDKSVQRTSQRFAELKMEFSPDICKQDSVIQSQTYLPWHDFFMSLCYLTAARSKDPNTKVGACIVDKENRVVSLGYNGMPRGIKDDDLPWGKVAANSYETKYPYVCHAEMNAILNERHATLDDCSIYVSKFPCCECAKLIIQAGIKKVIFSELKPDPWEEQVPTRKMFTLAGVTCRKFIPSVHQLNLNVIDGIGKVSITK